MGRFPILILAISLTFSGALFAYSDNLLVVLDNVYDNTLMWCRQTGNVVSHQTLSETSDLASRAYICSSTREAKKSQPGKVQVPSSTSVNSEQTVHTSGVPSVIEETSSTNCTRQRPSLS